MVYTELEETIDGHKWKKDLVHKTVNISKAIIPHLLVFINTR